MGRLVCHCKPNEHCHGDVLIAFFKQHIMPFLREVSSADLGIVVPCSGQSKDVEGRRLRHRRRHRSSTSRCRLGRHTRSSTGGARAETSRDRRWDQVLTRTLTEVPAAISTKRSPHRVAEALLYATFFGNHQQGRSLRCCVPRCATSPVRVVRSPTSSEFK